MVVVGDVVIMRVYAAMAEKERELVNERTRAALVVAKTRGVVRAATGDIGPQRRRVRGQPEPRCGTPAATPPPKPEPSTNLRWRARRAGDSRCKTLFRTRPKGKLFVHGPYRAVLSKPSGDPNRSNTVRSGQG